MAAAVEDIVVRAGAVNEKPGTSDVAIRSLEGA